MPLPKKRRDLKVWGFLVLADHFRSEFTGEPAPGGKQVLQCGQ